MNIITNIFSRATKAILLFGAFAALLGSSGFDPKLARAHEDPAGCRTVGGGISIEAFRADGVTSIGSGAVADNELIKYQATLARLLSTDCSFEDGTWEFTTPDGVVHDITPAGGIPLIGSPITSELIPYTVNHADEDLVNGVRQITVNSHYFGGISHTNVNDESGPDLSVNKNLIVAHGNLIVDKVTIPSGESQSFNFSVTGPNSFANNFSLTDAAAPKNLENLAAGIYSISEAPVENWNVASATCDNGDPITAVNIDGGETVTCTITNAFNPPILFGNLIVEKVTVPAGDPTSFPINVTGTGAVTGGGTGVISSGNPANFEVEVGTYSVTETVPAGWKEIGNTCVNVEVPADQTVTCRITNEKEQAIETRTQGFWSTHFDYTKSVFASNGPITLGGMTIDSDAELFGGFWANIAKTSTGEKRSDLDQARMQLAQQYLAAVLNCEAFGCSSAIQNLLAQASAAFSGTDAGLIRSLAGQLDSYNNSGDNVTNLSAGSASPKSAKSIANLVFWDALN